MHKGKRQETLLYAMHPVLPVRRKHYSETPIDEVLRERLLQSFLIYNPISQRQGKNDINATTQERISRLAQKTRNLQYIFWENDDQYRKLLNRQQAQGTGESREPEPKRHDDKCYAWYNAQIWLISNIRQNITLQHTNQIKPENRHNHTIISND